MFVNSSESVQYLRGKTKSEFLYSIQGNTILRVPDYLRAKTYSEFVYNFERM